MVDWMIWLTLYFYINFISCGIPRAVTISYFGAHLGLNSKQKNINKTLM